MDSPVHGQRPAAEVSIESQSAALPVSFAGTIGLFTPARDRATTTAVLFASPWGFEELCTRKFWRLLAEQLGNAGMASLRFDYPGTGDALDDVDFSAGFSVWEDSLLVAADILKTLSGCDRLIIISQGLGCVLAERVADRLAGPADLLDCRLLHEDDDSEWRAWLSVQGLAIDGPLPGPRLWQAHLSLDAARSGQGIALANRLLLGDDLATGRLVALETREVPLTPVALGAYTLIARADRWRNVGLQRFREWLVASVPREV